MRARIEQMARVRAEQLIRLASSPASEEQNVSSDEHDDDSIGSGDPTRCSRHGVGLSNRFTESQVDQKLQRDRVKVEAAAAADAKRRAVEQELEQKALELEEVALERVAEMSHEVERVRVEEQKKVYEARLEMEIEARLVQVMGPFVLLEDGVIIVYICVNSPE
jgi:hypothetical protein